MGLNTYGFLTKLPEPLKKEINVANKKKFGLKGRPHNVNYVLKNHSKRVLGIRIGAHVIFLGLDLTLAVV